MKATGAIRQDSHSIPVTFEIWQGEDSDYGRFTVASDGPREQLETPSPLPLIGGRAYLIVGERTFGVSIDVHEQRPRGGCITAEPGTVRALG
jgi:hypothetical protein